MRFLLSALAAAGVLALATSAGAVERRVGLAAPLDGATAVLGRQMLEGAEIAARRHGVELVVADDACTAEGGEAAARRFVEADVEIVAGFLCTEAIEAALPILSEAGIATVTPGARADRLTDRRDRTGWLVWRLAPRADAEADAVSTILVRLWRDRLFAIVDDGTIYGRDLSETFRLAAETAGLQPVFVDTYRPQTENQIGLVGRLRRAGASHVFVGGDREDVAIIARDAAGLDHELTIAAGEALRAPGETPLAQGTLMIGLPEWADIADPDTLARFAAEEIVPEGYALPSHAAVEVAARALELSGESGRAIADILSQESFATALGELSFDEKGDLSRNPFILLRYDGARFIPAE